MKHQAIESTRGSTITPLTGLALSTSIREERLQRKCDCGVHTIAGGECQSCSRQRQGNLPRAAVVSAPDNTLAVPSANIDGRTKSRRETSIRLPFENSENARGSGIDALAAGLGEGHPLSPSIRAGAQVMTDYPVDGIRVHDDRKSRATADFFNSEAFTIGKHVVLGNTLGSPTVNRDWLLMHEIAHSLQQTAPRAALQQTSIRPEGQADRFADIAAHTRAGAEHAVAPLSPAAVGLQRRVIWKHIQDLPNDLLLIVDIDDGDFVGGCVRSIVPHAGIKLIRKHPHTQLFNIHIGFITNARGEFCVFFYESVTGLCDMLCFPSRAELRRRWNEVLQWLREKIMEVLEALAILALIVMAAYLIYLIILLIAGPILVLA